MESENESNWAELPKELSREIIKKLSIASMFSFKYVCQNWQSVLSEEAQLSMLRPVPSPPWLTIPAPQSSRASFCNLYDEKVYLGNKQWHPPAEHTAVCVGSCHGWLAYIDDLCVMYLVNPFKHGHESSPTIIKLPSIETLPCILSIDEVSSSPWTHIKYLGNYNTTRIVPSDKLFCTLITKIVMSTPPFETNCVVMVIYGTGMSKRLAFCKLGDTSWKTLDGSSKSYVDLYYSSKNQRFYAVDETWSIDVWEFHESSSSMTCINRIETAKREIYHHPSMATDELEKFLCVLKKLYLLELNGEILLVVKYIGRATEDGQIHNWHEVIHDRAEAICLRDLSYKVFCFEVYKLDPEKKQWGRVNCLGHEGDYVAFLGVNNAVAFSVRDFPKLECNSIYFTREQYEYETRKAHCGHDYDLGVFSFRDNKIHQCYYLCDHMNNFAPLVWTSPNLC